MDWANPTVMDVCAALLAVDAAEFRVIESAFMQRGISFLSPFLLLERQAAEIIDPALSARMTPEQQCQPSQSFK